MQVVHHDPQVGHRPLQVDFNFRYIFIAGSLLTHVLQLSLHRREVGKGLVVDIHGNASTFLFGTFQKFLGSDHPDQLIGHLVDRNSQPVQFITHFGWRGRRREIAGRDPGRAVGKHLDTTQDMSGKS